MTPKTQQERSEAQEWAFEVQKLKNELEQVYDLTSVYIDDIKRLEKENAALESRFSEVMQVNNKLRQVLDEVIADCDSVLERIKK